MRVEKLKLLPEFEECSICSAKSGSPELCESCRCNRATISFFKKEMERLQVLCGIYYDMAEAYRTLAESWRRMWRKDNC